MHNGDRDLKRKSPEEEDNKPGLKDGKAKKKNTKSCRKINPQVEYWSLTPTKLSDNIKDKSLGRNLTPPELLAAVVKVCRSKLNNGVPGKNRLC